MALSRARRLALAAGMVAGVVACSDSSGEGAPAPAAERPPPPVTVAATQPATTVPRLSPLTGLPIPSDLDPDRAALAVKIDNHPDAEPQAGLDAADLVFEERVEGTTRLLAVFWSGDADRVGPIRSARTSDIDLLGSLGQPLLAWSGGNDGVIEAVAAVDLGGVVASWIRDPAAGRWLRFQRGAPHRVESGEQLSAANVVVLEVDYTTSAADADSPEAVSVGEGLALLLSADGGAAGISWQRDDGHAPFTRRDAAGVEVALPPGTTWVELPLSGHTTVLDATAAAAVLATR